MNKTALIIIIVSLSISIGLIFVGKAYDKNTSSSTETVSVQNVEIKDGIQYITINAKRGYSPRISTAQADIPTKLIVKTNGTYDCSLALVVRSVGYKKVLPQTGEEIIDLGTPKVGPLQGMCSMGMYNFVINFS